MKTLTTTFALLLGVALVASCAPSPEALKKVIADNPEVVFEAIEKHPDKFMEVVSKAARTAKMKAQEDQRKKEEEEFEAQFKNPLKPVIDEKRAFRGNKNAPIMVVEYSDFECPYCKRGYQTVEEVRKKYGDKIRFMYKHLPLDFHPLAMPAAERFEAIALQSADKAYKFHDEVFENQGKLKSGGKAWLDSIAKKLGVNMAKMKKDMKSDEVKSRIKADMEEAQKFGISGTPGFVVGGVAVKGAYPVSHFDKIISRLLNK